MTYRGPGEPSSSGGIPQLLLRVNWLVLAIVATLCAVGVAALYSVAGGSFQPWAERHAIRAVFGIGLILAISITPLRFWMALAFPTYFVALGLLGAVLLVGVEQMGARRWIGAGSFLFQPSELMKVALVLALARYYQWLAPHRTSRPIWVVLPLLLIAAPLVLVLKQPDLGTAVLFVVVGLGIMFLAGVHLLYFAGGMACVAVAMPVIWNSLHGYQKTRVLTFLNPERDPLGAGYHIIQSKIALGSGGVSGKGFMQGTQSQLDFLPEKHTDFIFTMLGEEMGFVGSVALLALYGALFFFMFSMSLSCRNQFSRLLVGGAGLGLFVYLFVNVAMVTGLLPVVGVPLPLISHGGTSMITLMSAIGLAMCGYVHRRERLRHVDFDLIR